MNFVIDIFFWGLRLAIWMAGGGVWIISKKPQLKTVLDKQIKHLQNKILGIKTLKITLDWQPNNCQPPSVTKLLVANNSEQSIGVLYIGRHKEPKSHQPNYLPLPPRSLPLYRDPSKERPFFEITPSPYGPTPFSLRAERDIFYFASIRISTQPEFFEIENTSSWMDFLLGAKRLYLIDSERTKFYVDMEGLKSAKKQIQRIKKQNATA